MIGPIDHIPSLPFNGDLRTPFQEDRTGQTGDTLYRSTLSFYSWHKWTRGNSGFSQTNCDLQAIIQIAKSQLLTTGEEADALSRLSDLLEHLQDGQIPLKKIQDHIAQIVEILTKNNPKSYIIKEMTTLEIKSPLSKEFGEIGEQLIDEILPNLSKIDAERLSRNLRAIFKLSTPLEILNGLRQETALIHKSQE